MTTQLLSKKRFEALPSVQFINQKLDIGKEVKKLLIKYFKRKIFGNGINTMPTEEGYKFIPLYDYYHWQDNKATNKNSIDEWKNELFTNYTDYHNPLNSIYIRIGIDVYNSALKKLEKLDEDGKRELLYGGGTTTFKIGVDFVDKFRLFGKDITRIGFKYNKDGIMSIFRAPKTQPPDEPEGITDPKELDEIFEKIIESVQRDRPRIKPTESKILNDVLGVMLERAENERRINKGIVEAKKLQADIKKEREAIAETREKLEEVKQKKKQNVVDRIKQIIKMIDNSDMMKSYLYDDERQLTTERQEKQYEEYKQEGYTPLSQNTIDKLYEEISNIIPNTSEQIGMMRKIINKLEYRIILGKKLKNLRKAIELGQIGDDKKYNQSDIDYHGYQLDQNLDIFTEDDEKYYEALIKKIGNNISDGVKMIGKGISFTDFVRFYKNQPKGTTAKNMLDSWANQIKHTEYKKLAKVFDARDLFSIYLANQLALILTQQRKPLINHYGNFPS